MGMEKSEVGRFSELTAPRDYLTWRGNKGMRTRKVNDELTKRSKVTTSKMRQINIKGLLM
jgi:hypothetical protein